MKIILKVSVAFFSLLASVCTTAQTVSYSALYDNATFAKIIDLTNPVGSIAGEAGTSPSGAATYTIPIQCPPGTNGMVPNLSIVYNSQSGNGILGQGWNLSGLSSITRAGWDDYHHGKVAPVSYQSLAPYTVSSGSSSTYVFEKSDAFVLDGTYLYPKSGVYGANATTYSTEAESYSVTTSYGSIGGGPEYFIVVSKDGSTMEFGRSTSSKFYTDDLSKIMMWRINKIIDINGNYIEFEYDNSNKESRISKIKYTGHASGILPYNEINFHYLERQDKNTIYDGCNSMQSRYLLWKIQILGETDVFKTYQMDYGKNPHSVSYLKYIQEFASDGTKLNDTRFKYGNETSEFVETVNTDNIVVNPQSQISTGDFDGDGLSDFLIYEYSLVPGSTSTYNTNLTIKRRSNTSAAYVTTATKTLSGSGVRVENAYKQSYFTQRKVVPQLADFNGDGRQDVIISNYNRLPFSGDFIYKLDYIHIFYTNSDATLPSSPSFVYTPPSVSSTIIKGSQDQENYLQIGDFDGDGSSDFITMLGGAIHFHSPRKAITNKPLMQVNLSSVAIPSTAMSIVFDFFFKEADNIVVVNMDGDAKSDLLVVTNGISRVFTLDFDAVLYDLHLNQIGADLSYPTTWHDINFGDFNGDGKTDILTGPIRGLTTTANWSVAYSDGKQFLENPFVFDHSIGNYSSLISLYAVYDRLVVSDFNGDGKSDILNFDDRPLGAIYNMYFSVGKGFVHKNYTTSNSALLDRFFIADDFNGDAKSELLYYSTNVSIASHDFIFTSFNPFDQSHLLSKITDGFNRTTEFSYEPLTKGTGTGTGDFYTKGSGETYPVNNVQYPLYVAISITSPNGIGGSTTTNFKYENFRIHRAGRVALGFEKVKSLNAVANVKTEAIFDLNRSFYVSYLKTSKTFQNSTGIQLSQTDHTYNFSTKYGVFSPGYLFTGMLRPGGKFGFKQQLTSIISQDLLKGVTTTSLNTFDTYGNIIASSSTITGGSLTMTSTSTTNFISTGGSLIPNRPSEIVTTNKRGSQPTVSTKNTITYHPNGLVKSTMTSPTSSTINYVKNSFEYDAFGNITSSVKSTFSAHSPHSPTTQYEYDTKGRFVISEENTLGNKKYITTHKFWGKPLSVTDYNGLISSYNYDKCGKLTSSTIPTSLGTSYTVNYSDGWDLGTNQLYYTYTQDPSSPDVKTWYDYLGRPVKTKQETFGGAWVESKITYDAKGNVASNTNNYLPTETPSLTNNTYDVFNRMLSSTNVFGTTNYAYSLGSGEEATTITLPDGKVKKTVLDASGKLIKSSNGIAGTIHYEYDSWGNEIASSIGTTSMSYHTLIQKEYDVKGMLKKMIDPDAGTTTYEYNTYGQLFKQVDPKGKATIYQYDAAGRVIQMELDGYISIYNYYGNIKDYSLQKLVVTSPTGDVVEDYYDYAIGGGITKHIKTTNSLAIEKRFTYDSYNNPLTTEYVNSGFKTKNHYDPKGFLQKITTNFTPTTPAIEKTLYEAFAMNGNEQVSSFKRVDGLNSSINYYNGVPNHYTTAGVQDLSTVYDYTNGNVMSRFDNITKTQEEFRYDAIDRLIEAKAQKLGVLGSSLGMMHTPHTITYDGGFWGSFGRITTKSDVGTYAYGGFPRNAVKSVTDPSTIISHETQDIVYTPFDKAQKITEKIGANYYEEKFVYDGNKDRAYSQQSQGPISPTSIVRKRWYMGDFEIDQKLTGSAKTHQLHYISSDVGLVGIVVEEGGNYKYYAAYTDHLGSIVTLTDDVGTVIAKQSYDPWGRERNPDTWGYAPTLTSGGTTPMPPEWLYRGYTSHEMLPEYGLINMNGRMYDPMNGRMMRPDNNISFPDNSQGYNRYSYAMNNPLKFTDPDGEWVHIVVGAFIGGLVNVALHAGRIQSGRDFAVAFGIGAVAGGVAAATGGASLAAGGAATTVAGAVGTGAVSGGMGYLASAPILLTGNAIYFQDPYPTGKEIAMQFAVSVATAGILNGTQAAMQGLPLWTPAKPTIYNYTVAAGEDISEASWRYRNSIGKGELNDVVVKSPATKKEIKVYRVFGGDARAQGFSWTTENPASIHDFRNQAGLPSGGASRAMNTAEFMIKGKVNINNIIQSRTALPLDGNIGGLRELIIDPNNVRLIDFKVLKP